MACQADPRPEGSLAVWTGDGSGSLGRVGAVFPGQCLRCSAAAVLLDPQVLAFCGLQRCLRAYTIVGSYHTYLTFNQ